MMPGYPFAEGRDPQLNSTSRQLNRTGSAACTRPEARADGESRRSAELRCPHERLAVVTPGNPGRRCGERRAGVRVQRRGGGIVPGMRSAVLRPVRWWAGPLLLAAERVFWPLQDTSWMVSYRWFLGMIVVFTAARLVLVSVGLPRTRIPAFRTPSPSGSIPHSQDGPAASGDRRPDLEPQGLFHADRHE